MICPKCNKIMSQCVNGSDESDAVYFNNCSDCNIQLDNYGYVLAFDGEKTYRSNYKLIKEVLFNDITTN